MPIKSHANQIALALNIIIVIVRIACHSISHRTSSSHHTLSSRLFADAPPYGSHADTRQLASALPSQLAAALLHHCAAYLGLDPARTVAPLLALPPLALNVTAPQWPVLLRGVQQFHAQVYKSHSLYGAVKQRYALPDRDAVATLDPLRGDFVFSPG